MKVLVAGATGAIGSELLPLLSDVEVRALTRRLGWNRPNVEAIVGDALNPATLSAAMDGVDVVVSSLGASVALTLKGRDSYFDVDVPANRNLINAAVDAGVERFVYVGVHGGAGYDQTRYVRAHETVCELLASSGLSHTTIRPTGVYTALVDFLDMARRGFASVIGDGTARTNPVDPRDVAAQIYAHLLEGPSDVPVGGPEIMTRRQIIETAFDVVGKPVRITHVPAAIPRTMAKLIRPVHPRLGDLVEFATAVSTVDALAPQVGTHTLGAFFASLHGQKRLTTD